MKIMHRAFLVVALAAALVSALFLAPHGLAAAVQHGHAAVQHGAAGQHGEHAGQHADASAAEHFHAMIDELSLSGEQQEALAGPFQEAFAAMQELHRLHEVIAAELTEEQRHKLAEMIHAMLGGAVAGD